METTDQHVQPGLASAYEQMLEESRARAKRALEMRAQGMKYREIGVALGVTTERARQIVAAAEKALKA